MGCQVLFLTKTHTLMEDTASMNDMAKLLMVAGASLFLMGLLIFLGGRIPWFGQLPGDIVVKRENFTLYVPLGTMILISVVLTVLLNLIGRLFR